ncbi:MAG: hypothetical protein IJF72_00745 [Clostridia bacterium]|nr:hypothetical protein [Clostridia bacterium]
MAEKEKLTKNQIASIVAIAISSVVAILAFSGSLVGIGTNDGYLHVVNVFAGTFGMAIYAICASIIVFSAFTLMKKPLRTSGKHLANFIVMFVLFTLLVHVFTTYGAIESSQNFGEYLARCYNFYYFPTFGGVLFGILAYPLVTLLTIWGASILLILSLAATLWFAVGFFYELATMPPQKFREFDKAIQQDQAQPDVAQAQPEQEEEPAQTAWEILRGNDTDDGIVYRDLEEEIAKPLQAPEKDEFSTLFPTLAQQDQEEDDAPVGEWLSQPIIPNADKPVDEHGYFHFDTPEEQPKPKTAEEILFGEPIEEEPIFEIQPQPVEPVQPVVEPVKEENVQPQIRVETIEPQQEYVHPTYQDLEEEDFSDAGNFEDEPVVVETPKPQYVEPKVQPAKSKVTQEQYKNPQDAVSGASDFVVVSTQKPLGKNAYQEGLDIISAEDYQQRQARHIYPKYNAPDLLLLRDETIKTNIGEVDHSVQCQAIENKLASFKINAKVVDVIVGPTVTRFVVDILSESTRMSEINKYSKDLKAALQSPNDLIIYAPLEGTSYVGIDTANANPSIVPLRTVMNSEKFKTASSNKGLVYALGKDIAGNDIVGDLTKMPHMLVAGATNMGKSVCVNTILISLMYKYSPEYLRFLLIDPKQVEFSMYERSPHLLVSTPIVEPNDALSAMDWLIDEMERRFTVFKCAKVKNIAEYNAKRDKNTTDFLNYIVLVVDELAELMTTCKKQFEPKITRLTQKARAAGIHIILATQRPSVDIITGTIKNNLPCRIALKVSSYHDSQTVLDIAGAESLIGRGDMLYKEPMSNLTRVQGAFVDTDEIEDVLEYIQENNETFYDEQIYNQIFSVRKVEEERESVAVDKKAQKGEDPLLKSALLYWLNNNKGRASIASIQRGLNTGFNRAGKIMDRLVELGYVEKESDSETGNKPRRVLVTVEEVEKCFPEENNETNE